MIVRQVLCQTIFHRAAISNDTCITLPQMQKGNNYFQGNNKPYKADVLKWNVEGWIQPNAGLVKLEFCSECTNKGFK